MNEPKKKKKNLVVKIFKILGWIIGIIVILLVSIALAIQIPFVQNKLTQKGVSFLEKKIGTKVALERIRISFPKAIILEGLYLEDQKQDTLLYAGKVRVDTDMWALTRQEIQLNDIELENCKAYVHRPENDSAFNFSYIIDAFVTDTTTAPIDTAQGPGWKFSVDDVTLTSIKARYHDLLTGNLADVSLGEFGVSMSEFDLDQFRIIVDEILLKDTKINFTQTKLPEVTEEVAEENQPITYDIGVADVRFENVHARYNQEVLGQLIRVDLHESYIKTNDIDLKAQRIALKEFALLNSFISYQQAESQAPIEVATRDPEPAAEKKAERSRPWTISLDHLNLAGNKVQYYDHTKPSVKNGFDYNHIFLSGLIIDVKDIKVAGSDIQCAISNIAFRDKSGFALRQLKGGINFTGTKTDLSELLLITDNSRFLVDAHAEYRSLDNIANTYPDARIQATVANTSIGVQDLLYLMPLLADSLPVVLAPDEKIRIDAAISGIVKDLTIKHFIVQALSDTYLKMHGSIAGLPDANSLTANLTLDKIFTTKFDLKRVLPDTLVPASIDLPAWMNLEGSVKGSMTRPSVLALLTSNFGSVQVSGSANLDSASAGRGMQAKLNINNLNLGKLLMQPETIGKLTLEASIDGKGLTPAEMNAKIKARLKQLDFQGYRYENLLVDGSINRNLFDLDARMNDENITFALNGDVNYREEVPRYHLTLDLKSANFKNLNFAQRPLRARGTLLVNLQTPDFKTINGTAGLRKVAIFNGEALYAIDSLMFASLDQQGRSELNIDSDLLKGNFKGTFNITSIATVLQNFLKTYYSIHDDTTSTTQQPAQQFDFNLQLKKTELLTDILVPELTSFIPGKIIGTFDSRLKKLDMKIGIDSIHYGNIGVRSFLLSTNSNQSQLNYNVFVDEIRMDSMKVDGLEFNGTVENDSIRTNLLIYDSLDVTKYMLGALFHSLREEKVYEVKLIPGEIKLNYVDWNVPEDNHLRFGGGRIAAHHVELSNGRERILMNSMDDAASTLFVGFRELNLEYLVSMVAKEKLASGLLHGDIYLVPDPEGMTFTADLGIKNLQFTEVPLGDLTLAVGRKAANRFDIDFGLKSNRNNIAVDGYYMTGDQPSMNLTATLSRVDLASMEPFTMGQLKNLEGLLRGQMSIEGSPDRPQIDGDLNFRNTSFLATYLNNVYKLEDETINFTTRGISFDEFTLTDENNNEAIINGMIATADYKNFDLQVDVNTNNFRLLNTTAADNDMFYGQVGLDATAKIRGSMSQPVIDLQVGLTDDSRLTYIVPQSEAGVMEQEGIVRFVDKTFKNDPFMKTVNPADTVKSTFTGLDLTARIELTDQETFTVIIDPTTEDQLTVKGNTTLTLDMDPTGDMNLTGRYEITEGSYNLSFYKFMKREFKIEEGSSMAWSGDPLNADMDLSATFELETAPADLFVAQLSDEELVQYKQRLPFLVFLNIKGELLKPEITFKLDMPVEERGALQGNVYTRLQDINTRESDLNKQVFALLILKRFISDNPLQNEGSGGLESTARTSVSKILTDQLNRLSQNVRGVELTFDLKSQEDYSTGQAQGQTQLQLGLSKNLFNDRLVVKVAGNVDLEGSSSSREATNYIGDLALEYKLTEDGRFRITGFRNSNYDMVDGELTETGAGVIYIKDYNLLSELFKANAKQKNR